MPRFLAQSPTLERVNRSETSNACGLRVIINFLMSRLFLMIRYPPLNGKTIDGTVIFLPCAVSSQKKPLPGTM